ncbi:uncharacterized protein LOC130901649 [Diorhabda carinulata]|uniref:uncharacterized protein LOC130901649 n=1 Tax=Diorhabda carinulata TaxID=1163345 RepID=UPI0025A2D334|nr:uncharacterized protein LOC130901649 [Diorhabda carinulata]
MTTSNPKTLNWELFKLKLENIKPYDGNRNTLNKFINRCENLIETYSIYNDQDINNHVLECIQEKLIDKAEMMVGNRIELNTWFKLKEALIQCFADRRDLDCILQELTRTRPFKNENLITFGNRLQLLKNQTIQRISNNLNLGEIDKNVK